MKVRQLLDLLSEYSPEAEVRLLHQPRYPLESTLIGVVGESEILHEACELGDEAEVVYLLEGRRVGYGRASVGGRGGRRVDDDQASYAIARARVDLRLAELRAALDRHEQTGHRKEHGFLEHLERALADLAAMIPI